jgi:hypothetical protein
MKRLILLKLHFSEDPIAPNEQRIQPVLCDRTGRHRYVATSVLADVTCQSCIWELERTGRLKTRTDYSPDRLRDPLP